MAMRWDQVDLDLGTWHIPRTKNGESQTTKLSDEALKILQEIVQGDFDGNLDLIIDDASHMYEFTKRSFETLFPLLRPGGYFIIEDWAWEHMPMYHGDNHPWALLTPLTELVMELVEAAGSAPHLISRMHIFSRMIALERGPESLNPGSFRLSDHIVRRPKLDEVTRFKLRLKSKIQRTIGQLAGKPK